MDASQALIIGVLVIAVTLITIALIYREPLSQAIRSGAPFGLHIGLREAKLLVGSPDKLSTTNQALRPTSQAGSQAPETDAKLVGFVPPLEPGRFRIVPLPTETPPQYFNWPYSPTGLSVFHSVPFLMLPVTDEGNKPLGHNIVTVQPSQENAPSIKEIQASVKRVLKVHLLLSAGHGWREHEGLLFLNKRIGYIEFRFSDGTSQRVDVILGKNIREWDFGNNTNLVTEIDISRTVPAWLSHDNTKRFDMMSVSIQGNPKDLQAIKLVGQFEDDHPGKRVSTPSINVSAITCESKPQH